MAKITAETATETVEFEATKGRKLVLELEDNGVDILHRCGGNARCATCSIEVTSGNAGEIGEAEASILAAKGVGGATRLSCQIRCDGDLAFKVLRQASTAGMEAGTRPSE
jgi:ferredoxin